MDKISYLETLNINNDINTAINYEAAITILCGLASIIGYLTAYLTTKNKSSSNEFLRMLPEYTSIAAILEQLKDKNLSTPLNEMISILRGIYTK